MHGKNMKNEERYYVEVKTYSRPEREPEIRRRISESRQEITESIRTPESRAFYTW